VIVVEGVCEGTATATGELVDIYKVFLFVIWRPASCDSRHNDRSAEDGVLGSWPGPSTGAEKLLIITKIIVLRAS
jgi:hypothetical protein